MKYVKWIVIFVFTTIFLSVPTPYAGVAFQKDSFTITLPDGWIEIPQDVLAAAYTEVEKQAPNAKIPRYDYGYQLGSAQNWMEYPYILVQVNKASRIPEHQLESMSTIDLNDKLKDHVANMRTLMSNASLGKMQYDKTAHVVWLATLFDVVDAGKIQGISGLVPTENGFVQIHAYSKTSNFESYLPVFRQIILGTTISPSLTYKPRWTDRSPILSGIDWGKVAGKGIAGAVVGGLIAIFAGRKRKNK